MLKRKNKIESNLGTVSIRNRLLRLLRSEIGFQVSLISSEGKNEENIFEESRKETNNVLVELEYQKARATMASQQVRTFC